MELGAGAVVAAPPSDDVAAAGGVEALLPLVSPARGDAAAGAGAVAEGARGPGEVSCYLTSMTATRFPRAMDTSFAADPYGTLRAINPPPKSNLPPSVYAFGLRSKT